ncbi:MAG: AAA family ATPase [Candidatus Hodarchaeota archaeon]
MSATHLLKLARQTVPYHVRRLSGWTVGAATRSTKLPIPRRLELSGLSTFKEKVDFRIAPGLNVVYGAAHNGKTTIANSLMFGLFGVLPSRGMTHKYFTGRLTGKDFALRIRMGFGKEPFLYEASFSLNQDLKQAKCALHEFENDATPEDSLKTSRMQTLGDIRRTFMEKTGIQTQESINNLINLVYFQEERNYLLGTRLDTQDGRFLRSSLVTSLAIGDFVNSVLSQGREELDSIRKQQNDYARKARHIQSARVELLDPEKAPQEQSSGLREKRKKLAKQIQQIRQMSGQRPQVSALITQLGDLEHERAKLETQLAHAKNIANDSDHEWQCDLCHEIIPPLTAQNRVEKGVCPICGEGAPYMDAQTFAELQSAEKETTEKIHQLRVQVEELTSSVEDDNLQELLQEYSRVTTELWEMERSGSQATVLADEIAATHLNNLALEAEVKRTELTQELNDIEKAIEFVEQYRGEIFQEFIQNLDTRFKQFQNSIFTRILIQLNPDLSLKIDRDRFEDFSKTERNLSEILFRLSLLDVFSRLHNEPAFMLIETPSSDLDESYKESLAMLLNSYVTTRVDQHEKNQTIVLTSLDPRFINQIFEGAERKLLSLPRISATTTPRQLKRLDEFF